MIPDEIKKKMQSLDISAKVQLKRCKSVLVLALQESDNELKNTHIISAINFAMSYVKALKTYEKEGKLKISPSVDLFFEENIRNFELLQAIRDHDFHRHPVIFRNGLQSMLGPIRLKTNNQRGSTVGIKLLEDKAEKYATKGGAIKGDRPLVINDFNVTYSETEKPVDIFQAIKEYIADCETNEQLKALSF